MDRKMTIDDIRQEMDNIEMENGSIEDSLDAIRRSQEEIEMSISSIEFHLDELEAQDSEAKREDIFHGDILKEGD